MMEYCKLTIGLETYSLEETSEFYTKILGFKSEIMFDLVRLEKDNVLLTFSEADKGKSISPIVIGLHVDNPLKVYERIKDQVTIKNDLNQCVHDNGFSIWDNNGNEVTFYDYSKEK